MGQREGDQQDDDIKLVAGRQNGEYHSKAVPKHSDGQYDRGNAEGAGKAEG